MNECVVCKGPTDRPFCAACMAQANRDADAAEAAEAGREASRSTEEDDVMTDERVAALLAAVKPLLDRESVQHFYSAWEFDHGVDGEALHAALADAYAALAQEEPTEEPTEDDQENTEDRRWGWKR